MNNRYKNKDFTFSEVIENILVAHMTKKSNNLWRAERGLAFIVNDYTPYLNKKDYVYKMLLAKKLMIYKWNTYRLNFSGMWIAKMIMEKKLTIEVIAFHKYSGNYSEKDKIVYNKVINTKNDR